MMEYKDEDIYDFSKGKLKVVYVTVGKGSLLEARLELIQSDIPVYILAHYETCRYHRAYQ